MKTQELNYIKTTISWLLENGDFEDSETSYNTAMNSIDILEEAISVTRCCTELFCLDNTDADGLTLHKRYKFINEDENNSLIIDDYGGNKAYLSNRFVKVIK